jgi:hypothetical protein
MAPRSSKRNGWLSRYRLDRLVSPDRGFASLRLGAQPPPLAATADSPVEDQPQLTSIDDLLEQMVANGAFDLHIVGSSLRLPCARGHIVVQNDYER